MVDTVYSGTMAERNIQGIYRMYRLAIYTLMPLCTCDRGCDIIILILGTDYDDPLFISFSYWLSRRSLCRHIFICSVVCLSVDWHFFHVHFSPVQHG